MKKISLMILLLCSLFVIVSSPVNLNAEDDTKPTQLTDQEKEEKYTEIMIGLYNTTQTEEQFYEACMNHPDLPDSYKMDNCSAKGVAGDLQTIILSFDKNLHPVEKTKWYYQYFFTTSTVFNAFGFKMGDMTTTIWIFVMNILSTIFEVLGAIISYLTLVFVNVAFSDVIQNTVRTSMKALQDTIFHDPDTTTAMIVVIGMIAILMQLASSAGRFTFSKLMSIVVGTFISLLFVTFIAIPGREMLYTIDGHMIEFAEALSASILQAEEVEPLELQIKTTTFDLLQLKPFMLRNFGSMKEETIAYELGLVNSESSPQQVEGAVRVAKDRVYYLLKQPTTSRAKWEVRNGNKSIVSSGPTASAGLVATLVGSFQRIMLAPVLIALSFFKVIMGVIKELLIGFTFLALYQFLRKPSFNKLEWLFRRVQWMFIVALLPIGFILVVNLISTTVANLADIHLGLALAFDVLLLVLFILAWRYKAQIMKIAGGMIDTASSILKNDYSPADFYHDVKDNFNKGGHGQGSNGDSGKGGSLDNKLPSDGTSKTTESDYDYDETLTEDDVLDIEDNDHTLEMDEEDDSVIRYDEDGNPYMVVDGKKVPTHTYDDTYDDDEDEESTDITEDEVLDVESKEELVEQEDELFDIENKDGLVESEDAVEEDEDVKKTNGAKVLISNSSPSEESRKNDEPKEEQLNVESRDDLVDEEDQEEPMIKSKDDKLAKEENEKQLEEKKDVETSKQDLDDFIASIQELDMDLGELDIDDPEDEDL